jgi:hypothetical protein
VVQKVEHRNIEQYYATKFSLEEEDAGEEQPHT